MFVPIHIVYEAIVNATLSQLLHGHAWGKFSTDHLQLYTAARQENKYYPLLHTAKLDTEQNYHAGQSQARWAREMDIAILVLHKYNSCS